MGIGIAILIRHIKVKNFGKIPTTSEFAPYFAKIAIKDSDFITKNFEPGSSGQSKFLRMLRGEISINDLVERAEE